MFIDRIRYLAAQKDEAIVKNNLHASLQDTALSWHIVELLELEKDALKALSLENG